MTHVHPLKDERGSWSSMRILLFCAVIPLLILMTFLEGGKVMEFPQAVWTGWFGLGSMLTIGAFGPRMAQYLSPIGSALVSAVSQAKRDLREPSKLDDHTRD